ncbi:hydroxymyristoyl-ACP dehydratase [Clostridium swellfunianum]|uniref:hydroxymyristoyl-ACP dehydratase n=1 Tax=Clostridium swellfunianum TaxID=1367462 RepID=UPI00202EC13C|nr:hydroxymyristoyl-ACP dehydratase [Clostridium swellfunianum]MCM0650736.1 hydroxymyristoyl-ACP dehydratase [Clostridium swellfunianum]
MTNINCSESCTYSINGKCTLNQAATLTSSINLLNGCGYFIAKKIIKKSSQDI